MNILVIAAHPDDETLGCGGVLLKHKENGDHLFWIIATSEFTPVWNQNYIDRKKTEIEQVAKAYGMNDYVRWEFPTAMLDTIPQNEIIDHLRKNIVQFNPEIIYSVHGGDVHSDHRILHESLVSAVKAYSLPASGLKRILSYETLSSTEAAPPFPSYAFMPNVYGDIEPYFERKLEILDLYASELQRRPSARNASALRALARYRGICAGVQIAEAFMLVRELF